MLQIPPRPGNIFFRQLVISLSFLFITLVSAAQLKTISGIVTDPAGAPLQGVTITVQKAKTGTSTDASGRFSLRAARPFMPSPPLVDGWGSPGTYSAPSRR